MPVAFRLYLPETWTKDRNRRKKTGVPDDIHFRSKTEIALEQIQRTRERGIPQGVVLADAGYGVDTSFRAALTSMGVAYVMGVQSSVTVWKLGEAPKPAPARRGSTGQPRKLLQRDAKHRSVSAKELAVSLPAEDWKTVTWRQGVKRKLRSRFAVLRVRPAHLDYWRAEPHPEEWLLIEWPADENEPTKYWPSTLPVDTPLVELVHMAKHRWIIERDYQELKRELGLGHYEGRGWRGFHHHQAVDVFHRLELRFDNAHLASKIPPEVLSSIDPTIHNAVGLAKSIRAGCRRVGTSGEDLKPITGFLPQKRVGDLGPG